MGCLPTSSAFQALKACNLCGIAYHRHKDSQYGEGSIAYVERAQPYPKDGKQGWYSMGFGYGAWVGILVASGFRVVPVQAQAWKMAAGIYG
jgi:hypothetical protein